MNRQLREMMPDEDKKLFLADIPTFVVNTIYGNDITQDICWYLSEFPDFLKAGAEKTAAEFRKLIEQTREQKCSQTT